MSSGSDTQNKISILLVEEDAAVRSMLSINLTRSGYSVEEANSASEGLEKISSSKFEIILCDNDLSNTDVVDLISQIKSVDPYPAILVLTSNSNRENAFDALRSGAQDYIAKPLIVEDALLAIRKAIEREQFVKETTEDKKNTSAPKFNFSNIIAQSDSMKEIFDTVRRLAQFNTTILITGESGTGKELLARAIHNNSPRRNKAFVAINCGAIPENLMESELFGHKKGAFTDATRDKKGLLEEASGGTIFLDEIGELPPHLQVKLLRVLQEQQIRRVGDEQVINVNLRVIAATLRDLEEDINQGRFRDDLFYRLNVVSINIPPLRERPDDIILLANYFLKKHSRNLNLFVDGITEEAKQVLLQYHWRGNVRELENCIERALVLTESNYIDVESLPEMVRYSASKIDATSVMLNIADDNLSIKQRTRALEIDLMLKALKKTGGNRTHAAKILEISHRALLYKLKEYGLSESE
jgi:two-component system, NtrC family, response regulator AtoC